MLRGPGSRTSCLTSRLVIPARARIEGQHRQRPQRRRRDHHSRTVQGATRTQATGPLQHCLSIARQGAGVRREYVLYMIGTVHSANGTVVSVTSQWHRASGAAIHRALPARPPSRRAGTRPIHRVATMSFDNDGAASLDVSSSKPYTSAVPEMDVIFEPLPGLGPQAGMTEDFRHVPAL